MGKKQPSPRQWTIQLEAVYHREREERIARAYELALPVSVANPPQKTREEEHPEEAVPTYRSLRASLQ